MSKFQGEFQGDFVIVSMDLRILSNYVATDIYALFKKSIQKNFALQCSKRRGGYRSFGQCSKNYKFVTSLMQSWKPFQNLLPSEQRARVFVSDYLGIKTFSIFFIVELKENRHKSQFEKYFYIVFCQNDLDLGFFSKLNISRAIRSCRASKRYRPFD